MAGTGGGSWGWWGWGGEKAKVDGAGAVDADFGGVRETEVGGAGEDKVFEAAEAEVGGMVEVEVYKSGRQRLRSAWAGWRRLTSAGRGLGRGPPPWIGHL